jgi:hypothetical protein
LQPFPKPKPPKKGKELQLPNLADALASSGPTPLPWAAHHLGVARH